MLNYFKITFKMKHICTTFLIHAIVSLVSYKTALWCINICTCTESIDTLNTSKHFLLNSFMKNRCPYKNCRTKASPLGMFPSWMVKINSIRFFKVSNVTNETFFIQNVFRKYFRMKIIGKYQINLADSM